jgi:hypothetical protein
MRAVERTDPEMDNADPALFTVIAGAGDAFRERAKMGS